MQALVFFAQYQNNLLQAVDNIRTYVIFFINTQRRQSLFVYLLKNA